MSSDEEEVSAIRPPNRKRQRLLSENSEQNVENDSPDEITIIDTVSPQKTTRVVLLDDEEEEEEEDIDYDDVEEDDVREEDEILDQLIDDEDNLVPSSAAASIKVKGLRQNVVDFFQNASLIDLESISGVSRKKAEQLVAMRPINSWESLTKKIQEHKSASINEDILINAVKTLKNRSVVEKLMTDCQKLATDINYLVSRLSEAQQPKCIPKELKLAPYQLVGLNWLILMHNKGINGILADDMGLGKTIQVIAFLAYLREKLNLYRHHLIIVPSSTLDNWEAELLKWCPEMNTLVYHGNQDERSRMRVFCARNPEKVDVILTTYNIAKNAEDRKLFKKLTFNYLVFDEAHQLKNMKTARYQSLIKIKSRHRLLLTGTPVQNNLVELMSLLLFTMPRMFMSKMTHVEALFSTASTVSEGRTQFEKERIRQAKLIVKPFVLRRVKEEVLKELPRKTEELVWCPLTISQEKLYKKFVDSFRHKVNDVREILEDESFFTDDSTDDIKRGAGMLMAFRKLANHPLLMLNLYTTGKLRQMSKLMLTEPTHKDANSELIFEDMKCMHDFELHKLCQQYQSINHFKLADEDILNSGKFQYLNVLLPKLKQKKQKCLLFSQFTMMLDIVEEYLAIKDYKYLRLDGTTKVQERGFLINEFNQNDEIFLFLLSTKAGGLGINLTAANVVIIHDIDFNPWNDKQAEDRSHRMGQTNDVIVYKLIGKDTVEGSMHDISINKIQLSDQLNENEKERFKQTVKPDMQSLLRQTLNL